jgi:hypothetical protein
MIWAAHCRATKFVHRAHIGAARVRIFDPRAEEFEEAVGGAFAKSGDKGGGAVGEDRDELIHAGMALLVL